MKTRTIKALIVVALLIPLSGCPNATTFALGVWVFSLLPDGGLAEARTTELLADGQTMDPAVLPAHTNITFVQPTTWSQMGSTFTLTQVLGGGSAIYVYAGTIYSDTLMAGTFQQTVGGNFSGRWTALRQP